MWNFEFLLFSLSLNVILKFLLTFHFGLIMKSQKLYNIILLLNCFAQYFLSLNTVISGNFGKNIFVTLTSHFPKFSYKSLLLASYNDDINAVGTTEKIFYENELCIMLDKGKPSHDFVFLKVHILTVHTLCYICFIGIFLTRF